jgi:hypothetical protein
MSDRGGSQLPAIHQLSWTFASGRLDRQSPAKTAFKGVLTKICNTPWEGIDCWCLLSDPEQRKI